MKTCLFLGVLCLAQPLRAQTVHLASGPARVSLIELYTSEGCSSCPPADRWLSALQGDPGLWRTFVPLAFHVNYWDSLGWKDRLSSPQLTERQYAYASEWGNGRVYTPCFVRDGEEWRPLSGGAGSRGGTAGRLQVDLGPDRRCSLRHTPVVPGPEMEAHVALLGFGLTSRVSAGENSGETLRHDFVVLGLASAPLLRSADGSYAASCTLPESPVTGVGRRALAAWVTLRGGLSPLQAAGGWIP